MPSHFSMKSISRRMLWTILLCTLTAVSASAQTANISISVKDVTIKELLKQIEAQSSYTFAYANSQIPIDKRVSVSATNRSIESILHEVMPDVTTMVEGKKIMLARAKEKSPKSGASAKGSAKNLVTGTVFDENGEPVIGATILLKHTKVGVTTNIDGDFTINTMGVDKPVLKVSYIGYTPAEVSVKPGVPAKIILKGSGVNLDEVVVTALGISREQKSLGYAVSKVNNEDLTSTVSGNWLNNLNGKVAGLSMSNAASGPLGSMRVVLRGEQSLNYGANEALFVVDGVPITTGDAGTGSGYSTGDDAPIDFGNGASEINPDDVESVTVLKGPAATALYGSRAANGAIVITTKSGREEKGVGVTLNSSITWEKAGFFPDFQGVYGPGSDNGFGEYAFWIFQKMTPPDGFPATSNGGRGAWGEAYDANKLRSQPNSYNYLTGEWALTPYVYADDWYTGFLETGVTYRNSVTISSNNGKGQSARVSVTDIRNDWVLPNIGYENQTVSFAFTSKMNKWLKVSARGNYLHKTSDNMPVTGYNTQNPFYMLIWGGTNIHPYEYKDEYFSGRTTEEYYSSNRRDGISMISRMGNSKPFNPYRQIYEATNAINKDRVYGNVALNIAFPVKGLTLDIRGGLDLSVDWRQQKKPYRSPNYERGFYREQNNRDSEVNFDFLLRYVNNKLINRRLGLSAAFGGNSMTRRVYRNSITLQNLGEEGVYTPTNVPDGEIPRHYHFRSQKVVNSFYGFVNLSWDDTYYLDLTARNDWSSTLAPGNWSFFYPSVSASVLLDKVLRFEENAPWIDMFKVRASCASVGNDTDPYGLVDAYSASSTYPSSYTLPTSALNYYIKPENVKSWEAGIETMFLHNRIGLDAAFYHSSTTNQIVSAVSDMFTGAAYRRINAGEITNRGIELALHVVPVQTRDFTWSFDINWSRNWNKLVSLTPDWDPAAAFIQNSGAGGNYASIRSYIGEEMYWIYGKGYKRAPEGSTYTDADGNVIDCSGMKIINPVDGIPYLDDTADTRIAKVNPTWRGGMTHSFRYKDFTLGLTFAAQMGGHAYSNTHGILTHLGKTTNTLYGRYDGFLVEGVVEVTDENGNVSYTPNTVKVDNVLNYYQTCESRTNAEAHTFKTDFLKLKEARLDYNLPRSVCRKLRVLQGAQLGVYVTNLFCITSFPQFDPETGTLNGTNVVSGIEMGALPMTRTYGVNIKLSF